MKYLVTLLSILVAACAPAATPTPLPSSTPTQTLAPTSTPSPTLTPSATPTITATPKPTVVPTLAQSLRGAAFNRKILIGAAVNVDALKKDSEYAATLAREYNLVVAENAMKWKALRPSQTTFNFGDADYLVSFAQANGMQVRGHNLAWHNSIPDWLSRGNFSRDQLIAILREHITTVVSRYRGKIVAWDVVNEAIDDQTGNLRETLWSKGIGADYIDMAFRFAREADPNAKLIYNDYNAEGMGKKSDAVYTLVKGMKERGIPIDGVGLQSHFTLNPPQMQSIDANMKRLGALGLEVEITELDVRIPAPATDANLSKQAQIYREYLQTCFTNENCQMFLTWGFTDKYSWIPSAYPGSGAALIFDEQYQPKLAYRAMMDVLSEK